MPISDSFSLSARWVFPVAEPPLADGVVAIADGSVVAVEAHGLRTPDLHLGNVAMVPGLVNAHTHLDLSGMAGIAPPCADFAGWLRQVVRYRRYENIDDRTQAIRHGLQQILASGTTLVGDITSGGHSWNLLADAPLDSVAFLELLGASEERSAQAIAGAREWLGNRPENDRLRAALSPHAPYSVGLALFAAAAECGRPVAIHLAESRAELELLENRRGPLVPFLKELGAYSPAGLCQSVDEVIQLGCRAPRALFVHANYLHTNAAVPSNAAIVYCPRTHAAFGHEPHPFRRFLARGIPVALGTDSLASNPDLDILAEAVFLHELNPDFDVSTLLQMITRWGAVALGREDVAGTIEAGKPANLTVLPLPNADSADPHELLFERKMLGETRRTMWRGQWR